MSALTPAEAIAVMSPRYYVSVCADGSHALTELRSDRVVSYPLPELPPGLVAQLNEWRKWRDALARGLRISTESDNEQARAFADLLGSSLQSGDPS